MKIVVTAPTSAQLFDALFAEVKRRMKDMPDALRELIDATSDRVVLKSSPTEAFISARTSSKERPESLAGVHSEHVLLVADEASGIPEEVFESAAGGMSTENACTLLLGNPVRTTGFFYKTQTQLTDATLRGGMTAQHGSPIMGLVPREGGENLIQPGGARVPLENMKQWAQKYDPDMMPAVDTGAGVGLLNFSGEPIDDAVRADVQSLLGTPIKKKADVVKPVEARKFTTDDYIDLSKEWLNPPGSGKVARRIIDKLGDLKQADFKRIDSKQLRQAAADLHKVYSRQEAKGMTLRPDLMNMLEIVRDKGLSGLRAAVGNKGFLPAIAGVGLAPTIFRLSQSGLPEEQRYRSRAAPLL